MSFLFVCWFSNEDVKSFGRFKEFKEKLTKLAKPDKTFFSMDPESNPFSPGAGCPPPELAGRDQILRQAEIALTRLKHGRFDRSQLLVGLRGVGKTVLLNQIAHQAEKAGYEVARMEVPDAVTPLAQLLVPTVRRLYESLDRMAAASDVVRRFGRVARSFIAGSSIRFAGAEIELGGEKEVGSADSGDMENDLPDLFVALGGAAKARGTAVLIVIDEMQYLARKDLAALIVALHKVSQEVLPVTLVGAGLPQLVGAIGDAKSYAERLLAFHEIGPLEPAAARDALEIPVGKLDVHFTAAALSEIYSKTKGYAYFLQEWGYEAWNSASRSPIDVDQLRQVHEKAVARLDKNFFRVRFARLTPTFHNYLRALAELGPGAHRSGEIARVLGRQASQVGTYRDELIKQGMIYSPKYGYTEFTVPLFDEFMKRAMSELPGPPRPRKSRRRTA